ncbi:sensor kinase [Rhodococcus rhodnii LMG 5362]|uniref:Sensor kinase n=2 Tax=Rhodococcus rhodnii TaxID=38312 RepID=R7WK07_9NOCA|nr:sensor kinase [Rhodococcus rhodnii LMG 5362]
MEEMHAEQNRPQPSPLAHPSPLAPVFRGIETSLHVLVIVLAAIVVVRAVVQEQQHTVVVVVLVAAFVAVYLWGIARRVRPPATWVWLAALSVVWCALMMFGPDAGYLVFGLFFLYLHLLRPPWNYVAVVAGTIVAIAGTAAQSGLSAAVVIGPVIGAAVATGIALGYRALFREAAERQRLIDELMHTREQLANQSRTAGTMTERARLAGEIHDTVAQGLSSIQMLLHSVESAAPDHPSLDRIRLARQTAAESLAETRRLIADLAPAPLDDTTLADALARITARAGDSDIEAEMLVEGEQVRLPMRIEAALVRIAQGAVSNVVRHSHASRMRVTLTYGPGDVSLDVVDDGTGFDTTTASFGLESIARRVETLGGTASVESEPGMTAVAVSIPVPDGGDT